MSHIQAGGESVEASREFGAIVHRCAVRMGSKTELGNKAGETREVIRSITTGNAHMHDAETLRKVATAAAHVAHRDDVRKMGVLIDKITDKVRAKEKPGRLPHRERN